jgi:hypothetical protein
MSKLEYIVKYGGRWYGAEKCSHPDIVEPYYLISGHLILEGDIEEIKVKQIKIEK